MQTWCKNGALLDIFAYIATVTEPGLWLQLNRHQLAGPLHICVGANCPGRGPASRPWLGLNSRAVPDGSFDYVQQVHLIPDFVKTPLRNVHNIFTHINASLLGSNLKWPHPEVHSFTTRVHWSTHGPGGRAGEGGVASPAEALCSGSGQGNPSKQGAPQTLTVLLQFYRAFFYQPHLHCSVYLMITGYKTPDKLGSSCLSLNVKLGSFFFFFKELRPSGLFWK